MTIVTDNEAERRIAERLCVTMAAAQATHIPVGSDQWFAELARAALAASDRDVLVARIDRSESLLKQAFDAIESQRSEPLFIMRDAIRNYLDDVAALTPLGGEGR